MDRREVYIYYPNGMARPKISWASIERILKDLRNRQKLEQRDEDARDRRATRRFRVNSPSLCAPATYPSCPTTIPPPCGIFSPG